MQPLDDFNGVTYVNEVIAINSLLCGSLGAWLRAIRGGLSLDFRAIANGVGAARAGGLQVWDARGWVGGGMGGGFGVLVGFFFFFFPSREEEEEGGGRREGRGGEIKEINKQTNKITPRLGAAAALPAGAAPTLAAGWFWVLGGFFCFVLVVFLRGDLAESWYPVDTPRTPSERPSTPWS